MGTAGARVPISESGSASTQLETYYAPRYRFHYFKGIDLLANCVLHLKISNSLWKRQEGGSTYRDSYQWQVRVIR